MQRPFLMFAVCSVPLVAVVQTEVAPLHSGRYRLFVTTAFACLTRKLHKVLRPTMLMDLTVLKTFPLVRVYRVFRG